MTPPQPPGAEGVLVVDKPSGPTSHDVVARLRRMFSTRRVGHAGTLDPPATGVLIVGLGRATRLLRFLQALEKVYAATVVLGVTTTTQDATGEVLERRALDVDEDELRRAVREFVGDIEQVPPMVSAVKVGGERLYRAARRGEVVDRPPRTVHVYDFAVESFDRATSTAAVLVRCSAGTYVRTLAADLGEHLGCGAHLGALRRLAVGSFRAADAVTLAGLESMDDTGRRTCLLPMAAALRDFPSVSVEGDTLERVRHGRPIDAGEPGRDGPVAVLDPLGELVAVYEPPGDAAGAGTLRPAAVLPAGAAR